MIGSGSTLPGWLRKSRKTQQRGAPHFHLLVWGTAFLHHQRLACRWFEIVGSNDPRHLAAGTRVEAVRSRNGVMRYASKLYMGKDFEMPPGWEHVGRFWGITGRADLPLSGYQLSTIHHQLSPATAAKRSAEHVPPKHAEV